MALEQSGPVIFTQRVKHGSKQPGEKADSGAQSESCKGRALADLPRPQSPEEPAGQAVEERCEEKPTVSHIGPALDAPDSANGRQR
jgi:hypothetical protein